MKPVSKVLTANRLPDGIAVWYARTNEWVEDFNKSDVVSDREAIAWLEKVATETLANGQYCDVVLVDVEETVQGPRPLKLRERIRADGPTITPDLGSRAA